MKTTNDTVEVQQIVNELRKERFASLPETLVRDIVSIEAQFVDDRPEAMKRIRMAVESYLAKERPQC